MTHRFATIRTSRVQQRRLRAFRATLLRAGGHLQRGIDAAHAQGDHIREQDLGQLHYRLALLFDAASPTGLAAARRSFHFNETLRCGDLEAA